MFYPKHVELLYHSYLHNPDFNARYSSVGSLHTAVINFLVSIFINFLVSIFYFTDVDSTVHF